MNQRAFSGEHHFQPPHRFSNAAPTHQTARTGKPATPSPGHPHRPDPPGIWRRWIVWEWIVVLGLLTGLAITLSVLSVGVDSRRLSTVMVEQMKAAASGHATREHLFGGRLTVSRHGNEIAVTVQRIPTKVCVLASWDLVRSGTVTVNGVTPSHVSAAKLVELCNEGDDATLSWSPKPAN